MNVKKSYKVGDTVWIYGIGRSNVKTTQGKVIKVIDLSDAGHTAGPHYVIEVPTHIEPLLEIRTWQNISQDERGPVGSFRELGNVESTIKFVSTTGFAFDDNPTLDPSYLSEEDEDNVSPEQIHAAIEKSQQVAAVPPLNLRTEKPKRRYFKKKPKHE